MAKHTPGPWGTDDYGVSTRLVVIDRQGNAVPIANGSIEGAWDDDPEARANAILFAAAPELLEALQAAVTYLEAHRPKGKINDIYHELNHYENSVMQPARAAIQKATGGNND